jgi:hypothetical protein
MKEKCPECNKPIKDHKIYDNIPFGFVISKKDINKGWWIDNSLCLVSTENQKRWAKGQIFDSMRRLYMSQSYYLEC